jgi:ribosomal RNA-processing protein 9
LDGRKKEKESGEKESKNLVVVAGVAKEPRLGRWMRFKDGKEGAVVAVIPMQ